MDCSLPGSANHGDSPGKNTGVGCYALFQGIFPLRDQTQISCIAGRFFTVWATTCIFKKGFEQRRIQHWIGAKVYGVQAFVDWCQEGQHDDSLFHLGGSLSSYGSKSVRLSCTFLDEELRLHYIAELLFLDCFSFVPRLPHFPYNH